MTSVKCGSRPHHCRTTSRAAALQRVCPTTRCSASRSRTCSATASRTVMNCGIASRLSVEDEVGDALALPALVAEQRVVLLGPLVEELGVAVPGEPDRTVH